MFKFARNLAAILFFVGVITAVAQIATAQTVTVTPGSESVGAGMQRQYTATVTGLANSAVVWSILPTANTNPGTIDQTGLYTAPSAIPVQNPVAIQAASVMMPSVAGIAYANIMSPGPTLTSVSPNPLKSGSATVTLTGTGFKVGGRVILGGTAYTAANVTPTTMTVSYYLGNVTSVTVFAFNTGSTGSNILTVPVSGTSSGGTVPVISPANLTLAIGATQQFSAGNVTGWAATVGSISATGLYTAPAALPATPTATISATGPSGTGTATVNLITNVPPTISALGQSPLPLGLFSTNVTGTGFIQGSVAKLNSTALVTSFVSPTTLNVSGFAGTSGQAYVTVVNGGIAAQPFAVQVGLANASISAAGARRFLEQAAFGPTPADANHVQSVGPDAWLTEQFALGQVSNYNTLLASSQSTFTPVFLTNAVTNPDQLRQRVAFALSQIFVTSINKLLWSSAVIPYQHMLMADSFGNFRQILGDVTLSPAMGQYLDMANNGKANPATGSVANENFAREVLQLFSIGTTMLNLDGSRQFDANNLPVPAYTQTVITEFARVFTGWTYAPAPGGNVVWGAYQNQNGPMVAYSAQHDTGAKTLLNGAVAPAGLSAAADLNFALDNIFNHPNTGVFIGKQLIQHLVMSNPSPAYISRVADKFNDNGFGVRGDMQAVISQVLMDSEARANDNGGNDQTTDGHLQEPLLFVAGIVRAFGGLMNNQNYFAYDMTNLGQDLYNPASVFNYYSPNFRAPGTSLAGGEFQINTPNSAVYRSNIVYNLFSAYNNPIQTNGPGTTIDLTPFVSLASQPATLVDALDLTLTHGVMPSAMKQMLVTAITAEVGGNVPRVQTGVYLILTSSYYNVWH